MIASHILRTPSVVMRGALGNGLRLPSMRKTGGRPAFRWMSDVLDLSAIARMSFRFIVSILLDFSVGSHNRLSRRFQSPEAGSAFALRDLFLDRANAVEIP